MNDQLASIFAVLLIVGVVYWFLVNPMISARADRRELKALAASRGWDYLDVDRELQAQLNSGLFAGRTGKVTTVVSWIHRGYRIRLFDYDSGSGDGAYNEAVAMVEPVAAGVPAIKINHQDPSPFRKIPRPVEGMVDVPFADRGFRILSRDPEVTAREAGPLVELLRGWPTLTFCAQDGAIALVEYDEGGRHSPRRGWLAEPEPIATLLADLADVVAREFGEPFR